MSTICKIIVENADTSLVSQALQELLSQDPQIQIEVRKIDSLYPLYDKVFNSRDTRTSHYFISDSCPQLTEIHYNSFDYRSNLASMLSARLRCKVVIVIYQSTAESGYFSLHINGEKVRSIEFGDDETTENSGDLLDFEEEPLGHNISDDGDDYFVFDSDDLEDYLKKTAIGAELYSDDPDTWILLHSEPKNIQKPSKTWWKFW